MFSSALTRVALFLKAANLPQLHNGGLHSNIRYDPFVVVSYKVEAAATTEVIQNDRNPHWPTPLIIDYKFQERQVLKFQVYYKIPNAGKVKQLMDRVINSTVIHIVFCFQGALKSHIFLGEIVVSLKEIIDSVINPFAWRVV